jgi:hypothetical protein
VVLDRDASANLLDAMRVLGGQTMAQQNRLRKIEGSAM